MGAFRVAKPFNTFTQRFAAGVDVPHGADLAPHTLDGLRERGFVVAVASAPAPTAPAPEAADGPARRKPVPPRRSSADADEA